jgi:hypothetical protein
MTATIGDVAEPLTDKELTFLHRFSDVLLEGRYCPDPSPFHADIVKRAAQEIEQLNNAMLCGESNWPTTVAPLEQCLLTFPAGRSFLSRWDETDKRAATAEAEVERLRASIAAEAEEMEMQARANEADGSRPNMCAAGALRRAAAELREVLNPEPLV